MTWKAKRNANKKQSAKKTSDGEEGRGERTKINVNTELVTIKGAKLIDPGVRLVWLHRSKIEMKVVSERENLKRNESERRASNSLTESHPLRRSRIILRQERVRNHPEVRTGQHRIEASSAKIERERAKRRERRELTTKSKHELPSLTSVDTARSAQRT